MINKFNQLTNHPDLGKFVLRVSLGVLMLLHGLHKMEPGGLAGIQECWQILTYLHLLLMAHYWVKFYVLSY